MTNKEQFLIEEFRATCRIYGAQSQEARDAMDELKKEQEKKRKKK